MSKSLINYVPILVDGKLFFIREDSALKLSSDTSLDITANTTATPSLVTLEENSTASNIELIPLSNKNAESGENQSSNISPNAEE